MILYCPRCGTELGVAFKGEWFSTRDQCSDCGVALSEAPRTLAPSDDELEYALAEWPTDERTAVTAGLVQADIPYRWLADHVLVLPAAAEYDVGRLFRDLSSDAATSPDDASDEELDDYAGAEGGEEVQEAMANLFVAADRLQHTPSDVDLTDELLLSADVVTTSPPPYGIEPHVWRSIQELAATVSTDARAGAAHETLSSGAAALRDRLRAYV